MAPVQTAVLGPASPPVRGTQDGTPTSPTARSVADQPSGRALVGRPEAPLYIGVTASALAALGRINDVTASALAALGRINDRTRLALASQAARAGSRPTGE